jgi:hypothetical protein
MVRMGLENPADNAPDSFAFACVAQCPPPLRIQPDRPAKQAVICPKHKQTGHHD